jgi:uncharacterized membrane protein
VAEGDERGDSGVGLGRTLALSDGIFAIAMTLVAFQIQLPDLHGSQVHGLADQLGRLGDGYYVFALSFLVIGLFWLGHYRLFGQLKRADEPLMLLNLVFLMTIAILPFPSSVLGRYGGERAAVILYASNMALAGTLLTALILVAHYRQLMVPMTTMSAVRKALWRSGTMAVVFALSIPVAIVSASVAPYTWIAILPLRLAGSRSKAGPPLKIEHGRGSKARKKGLTRL